MRINISYTQKCKAVFHIFQALFIFVGGCITIAVLTKAGETGGATKYYFALCFLSVPAIIYLVMVPMWSRTRALSNAYAFAIIDVLYTILWFGAFIAVAMWNSKGIKDGAKEAKVSEANCTTFKYGPETKCSLSRAAVGLGAVVFLFFALTTAISAYYLHKFMKEGVLPYESQKANPHHATGDTGKDNAWSTEIEAHHRDSDDEEDRHTDHGGNQQEDEYALLHTTETDEGGHPGRPLSWGEDRRGTGYADVDGHHVQPPYAAYNDGPDALSPGGYEEYRRDTVSPPSAGAFGGKGYSFSGGDRH